MTKISINQKLLKLAEVMNEEKREKYLMNIAMEEINNILSYMAKVDGNESAATKYENLASKNWYESEEIALETTAQISLEALGYGK